MLRHRKAYRLISLVKSNNRRSLFKNAKMSLSEIHNSPNDSWHGKVEEGGQFSPEKNRYHLYIAHRVNLIRHLKGLTEIIDISVVKPYPKGDEKGWPGWKFPKDDEEYPGSTVDKLFGSEYLHDIYFKADKDYSGRYSVPLLWDKVTETIVNNESAELLRSLPLSFNDMLPLDLAALDFYPTDLQSKIDTIGEWLSSDINTGVYKAGFAPDQETYDKMIIPVFGALNKMEKIISASGGPYVLGDRMTELDIKLYATVVRFDTVYVQVCFLPVSSSLALIPQHFKCNLGTIRHDYPVINNWFKNLYWNIPGFKESTNFKHIKENYTKSHYDINPKAITPIGPYPDVEEKFERDFSKIKPGSVKLPAVLEYESTLNS